MENKIQNFNNEDFGDVRVLMTVRMKRCGYKAWLQQSTRCY